MIEAHQRHNLLLLAGHERFLTRLLCAVLAGLMLFVSASLIRPCPLLAGGAQLGFASSRVNIPVRMTDVTGKAASLKIGNNGFVAHPRATPECGVVEGLWSHDMSLASFRGIPYGAPPERWQPSKPASSWPEPLLAFSDGPICFQHGAPSELEQSEDCLNLNVHVPGVMFSQVGMQAKLPVLVFIHGGMNTQGSVASYGPIENIVKQTQGHVLVSFNYRLNVFGFLALPELSAADYRGVSGNYAITDLLLLLRWVRQHIHAFGGDASSVTLIGQSSGASNIYALLACEEARGLFHAAIALSGSPNISMSQAEKEQQDSDHLLPSLLSCTDGSDGDVLSRLRSTPARALLDAMPASYATFDVLYDYPVDRAGLGARVKTLLHVDGVTVGRPLLDALAQGLVDVPLLMQATEAEMNCYPHPDLLDLTEAGLKQFLRDKFAPVYGEAAAKELAVRYMHESRGVPELAVYLIDGDTASFCGLRQLALTAGRVFKSPVYLATVTAPPATHVFGGPKFAYHNWDLMAASETWRFYNYSPAERDVIFGRRVLSSWVELARGGRLDKSNFLPVQEAEGFPAHYYCNVIGAVHTEPVLDFKADICLFWQSLGVGQQWWWIN